MSSSTSGFVSQAGGTFLFQGTAPARQQGDHRLPAASMFQSCCTGCDTSIPDSTFSSLKGRSSTPLGKCPGSREAQLKPRTKGTDATQSRYELDLARIILLEHHFLYPRRFMEGPHESPTLTKHFQTEMPSPALQQHSVLALPTLFSQHHCWVLMLQSTRPQLPPQPLSQVPSSLSALTHPCHRAWQCHKMLTALTALAPTAGRADNPAKRRQEQESSILMLSQVTSSHKRSSKVPSAAHAAHALQETL